MAKLIFVNGQTKEVGYSQAAKIYQILQGKAEPENEAQAEYISKIANVQFDKITKEDRPWDTPRTSQPSSQG